jgi:hypothetical protein
MLSSVSSSFNLLDSKNNNLTSSSIKTFYNLSVFENEEYFGHFHKLLQQFDLIDFDLQLLKKISQIKNNMTSINNDVIKNFSGHDEINSIVNKTSNFSNKPFVPSQSAGSSDSSKKIDCALNSTSLISNTPNIHTQKNTTLNRINQMNSCSNSSSGFNFKNISKKFNFKSWFTSSNSQISQNSKNASAIHNFSKPKSKSPHKNPLKSLPTSIPNQMQEYSYKFINKNLGSVLNSNIYNKTFNENIMKHSLSEPSINALIQ